VNLPVCKDPRPADYPLPVHKSGWAYLDINKFLIVTKKGWVTFQKGKSMADIIPEIDRLYP